MKITVAVLTVSGPILYCLLFDQKRQSTELLPNPMLTVLPLIFLEKID